MFKADCQKHKSFLHVRNYLCKILYETFGLFYNILEALDVEFHRKKPGAVQRRCALNIACSYRTVSEEAVLVIAGVMPIRLMAK